MKEYKTLKEWKEEETINPTINPDEVDNLTFKQAMDLMELGILSNRDFLKLVHQGKIIGER